MIKSRSKSKIKHSVAFSKKQNQQKLDRHKKGSKQLTKKNQQKQNTNIGAKLGLTSVHSKKKFKNLGQESLKPVSPLCLSKKKNQPPKNQDENFIEKLFSQTQQSKQKNSKNFLLQQLIQNLLPQQSSSLFSKSQNASQHHQSTDILKQLHLKNQQVTTLQQQIQQLKLYISNFIFKVFDMTVLCRKYSNKIGCDDENLQFCRKTDEVISYLDSIIRHWKLQQKIKTHCQNYSRRMSNSIKRVDQNKKRCHTQSLKIPIQDYLQSLQNTQKQNLCIELQKYNKTNIENQQSQQIMKILSRRSSGINKQQQQMYVAIKKYIPKNDNQLTILPGQRISVLQKKNNDRWLGVKQGKIGYFPKQCLFQT